MDVPTVHQEFGNLPPLLQNSWLMDPRLELLNEEEMRESGITTSELCKRYLRYQLARYNAKISKQANGEGDVPSLITLAVRKVRKMLAYTEDLDGELDTLLTTVSSTLLRYIFGSPETPHVLLRRFISRAQVLSRKGDHTQGMNLLDIDEMILQNGKFLRFSVCSNKFFTGEEYLVKLEDLRHILGDDPNDSGEILEFRRRDPPKGGFEILDQLRPRWLRIIKDDGTFRRAFEWITRDVLKGLDWTNVLVAGPFISTVLMLTGPSRRLYKSLGKDMIDLYLCGLTAREAQDKVKLIYYTWKSNLDGAPCLVAKHPHSITLSTGKLCMSIRIHFRLYHSPIHVLLAQDLDPLAIGYNGHRVLMLPRCARALEAGYSTFTTDLIHGDADLGRLPTLMSTRMFKLANRGFGLRISPSYLLSLSNSRSFFHELEQKLSAAKCHPRNNDPAFEYATTVTEPRCATCVSHDGHWAPTHERYRKPAGDEPGLKTLKRVAFLGRNYIDRFFFRDAPCAKAAATHVPSALESSTNQELRKSKGQHWGDTSPRHKRHMVAWDHTDTGDRSIRYQIKHMLGPYANVAWLRKNKSYLYSTSLESLDRLGQFETFMRHAEVWRLHFSGYITIPRLLDLECKQNYLTAQDGIFSSYLSSEVNEGPEAPLHFVTEINRITDIVETLNHGRYRPMQEAICSRLGIPLTRSGYRGYLTRRIRLTFHGPDLETAMAKPLTFPLTMPQELEDYIHKELLPSIPNLPRGFTNRPSVTNVHDPFSQDGSAVLPSLRDTEAETGNLRYWIVDDKSIWAGQHPMVDELFELFKAIFSSQSATRPQVGPTNGIHSPRLENKCDAADPDFILTLAHTLKGRIGPPYPAYDKAKSSSNDIDPTEKLLFQAWVLSDPGRCDESAPLQVDSYGSARREPFDQDDYPYPVPESLFWEEGDEGQWPSGFVPEWPKVPRLENSVGEVMRDNTRRADIRHPIMIVRDTDLGFTETEASFSSRSEPCTRTFASLQKTSYDGTDEDDVDEDVSEVEFSSDDEGF